MIKVTKKTWQTMEASHTASTNIYRMIIGELQNHLEGISSLQMPVPSKGPKMILTSVLYLRNLALKLKAMVFCKD